ncbi:unnamed protein product [Amoebophrya sp. A120]|nr:unnamed protein product [Amoebophrya sp. A120]|eukprot:GSA120T00016678001.1
MLHKNRDQKCAYRECFPQVKHMFMMFFYSSFICRFWMTTITTSDRFLTILENTTRAPINCALPVLHRYWYIYLPLALVLSKDCICVNVYVSKPICMCSVFYGLSLTRDACFSTG